MSVEVIKYLPCLVSYEGTGRLKVVRLGRADLATLTPQFCRYRVDPATGRVVTEHVPGYAGLSFSAAAWDGFQLLGRLNPPSERFHGYFQHPEWTCHAYEEFLTAKTTLPPTL